MIHAVGLVSWFSRFYLWKRQGSYTGMVRMFFEDYLLRSMNNFESGYVVFSMCLMLLSDDDGLNFDLCILLML